MNRFKKIISFVLVFAIILSVSVINGKQEAKAADTIWANDVMTPEEGCILVKMPGTYYAEYQEALNLINSYRKEACDNGYPNPNTGVPFKPSDYGVGKLMEPIKWSYDLEFIARIRAAEAAITMDHVRTTNTSCFNIEGPNGVSSFSEVLAWNWSNGMTAGIQQWYDEKYAYLNKTGGVTGHYTAMINPNAKYVGLGAFCQDVVGFHNTTAGEFCGSSGLSEAHMDNLGAGYQILQLSLAAFSDTFSVTINGTANNSVAPGTVNTLKVDFGGLDLYKPYYTSSNTDIATIDANGKITAKAIGQTTITLYNAKGGDRLLDFVLKVEKDKVVDFVTRLYKVCLSRTPDSAGLNDWTNKLKAKQITGVEAAYGFVFSNEFKGKNLCNSDYVEQLYKAFLGRSSDPAGKQGWVKELENGKTREEVFNGFALSQEFGSICSTAGISQGTGITIPKYGTVPTGKCTVCGKEDGVTGFVKRLYKVCLDRNADASGLKDWCSQLWNHTASGSSVAYGFIFSAEFVNKNYSDANYVEYLYKAFMGRGSDKAGKADWLNRMANGWTRKQVFDGFVGSQEFTKICQSYGIKRD